MPLELTCANCHARQSPWDTAQGDIGPCRYCGVPLPRPAHASSSTATAITAAPPWRDALTAEVPASLDASITANPPEEWTAGTDLSLIRRPYYSLGSILSRLPRLVWYHPAGIALLLVLSVTAFGFSVSVDRYIHRPAISSYGTIVGYEYDGPVKLLGGPGGFFLSMYLAIRLCASSRASACWFWVFFLMWGFVICGLYEAGFESGQRVAPHLNVTVRLPRIGTTVGVTAPAAPLVDPKRN